MPEDLFAGIFDSEFVRTITVPQFLLCLGVSLAVGLLQALCYTRKSRYTQSFVLTLALLPAVVCVVIMMVNGNVGTGVAVAGAFSLVRFRSVPGTAREICVIFLAMAAGLIAGMGYLAYAVLFSLVLCAVFLLYGRLGMGGKRARARRLLRVTVPEDLNYTDVFADIFAAYTLNCELIKVKLVNMGSLFRLTYELELREQGQEKQFIDELRCRNGNLEISLAHAESAGEL